jgi:hypothetical protein
MPVHSLKGRLGLEALAPLIDPRTVEKIIRHAARIDSHAALTVLSVL